MVSIRKLSPSKFKYKTLQISAEFIKFLECQVPFAQI